MDNIFFNAHHSPVGAFATFTLGHPGASGGFGIELSKPADHDVYIGLEAPNGETFELLPFFSDRPAALERERYELETLEGLLTVNPDAKPIATFPRSAISRGFQVGSDTWSAGDLTFTIHTSMPAVPDPETASVDELRAKLAPALAVELTIDNRHCDHPRRACFGFKGNDPYCGMRHIANERKIVGIGQGRHVGIVTNDPEVKAGLGFEIGDVLNADRADDLAFGLGVCGALVVDVPARTKRTYRFAVCFYRGGLVTSGIDASYYYTELFSDIEDVALYALDHFDTLVDQARKANEMLERSRLSDNQRFMFAHATHSYFGCTQLLKSGDKPIWVVNEGEYRMMNTFDLTADHLFFELKMNPWTVRNVLDLYIDRYSYRDDVREPGEACVHPGGISFTHDMGVANVFSRQHYSAYERPGLHGCFSYMTHEQLVNWVCCSVSYVASTADWDWYRRRASIFEDSLRSLINRDNPDPTLRNGLMGLDSSRTRGGTEITTYDSLDTSLGQARGNVYMGTKTWASYVGLEALFSEAGRYDLAQLAGDQADLAASTIASAAVDGILPAIVGEHNEARIISAIEGLIFPHIIGLTDILAPNGRFGKLAGVMAEHLRNVLVPGKCLFPDNGWKLSSTSNNSWLSKIYLSQFVAREILGVDGPEVTERADEAHMQWLMHPDYSYFAWSDQMVSGRALASRYYPRGVTAVLWLDEGVRKEKNRQASSQFVFSRGQVDSGAKIDNKTRPVTTG